MLLSQLHLCSLGSTTWLPPPPAETPAPSPQESLPSFFQLEHHLCQLPLTLDRVCYLCSWYLLQYWSHSIVIDFTIVSFHLNTRFRHISLHTQITFRVSRSPLLLSGELMKVWHHCKEKRPCGLIRKGSANPWGPGQHEFLDDQWSTHTGLLRKNDHQRQNS